MDRNKWILIAVAVVILLVVIFYEKIYAYMKIVFLNSQQKEFVKSLNPQAQLLFTNFIKDVEKETGYTVYITSAYRSFGEQADLKAQNPNNASAGNSFHNYGLAIDINGVKDGVFELRKSTSKEEWESSGIPAIAQRYNLRWGGNFSSYHDPIHFDLGNYYNIAYLKQLAEQTYGSDPYKVEGNKLNLLA